MSCSPFDLRDYLLGELTQPDRRQLEKHVNACSGCREELDRLQVTHAALCSLAEEEIPQRIAFVSDKVFEPSPWRRALQAFWSSSARLGFVSAAMFSCALVVTTLHRPAPVPAGSATVSQVQTAKLEADFERRVHDAVTQAVAESEARQTQKTAKLIQALENRNNIDRQGLLIAFNETLDVERKHRSLAQHAVNDLAAAQQGDTQ